MDSFFGVGLPELLVILLLAGVIMGPQQILRVARTLGVWTARVQREYRGFMRQLNKEIDAMEAQEIKQAFKEVQKVGQQVDSLRRDVRAAPNALLRQGDKAVADVNRQLQAAVAAGNAAAKGRERSLPAAALIDDGENSIHPPQLLEVEDDPAI
ncbi:MAG: hypothetical protein Fur0021_32910 [Candidatus Promineifilaceae bacterium]